METKKMVCIQCHNACRLAATVDDGRLISVEPDEDFPGAKSSYSITKGCPRRRNVIEYFYHPGRLNYPCMITLSSNPIVTAPNTRLVYKALKRLDLYVVVDFFMTPSAQLAPACLALQGL